MKLINLTFYRTHVLWFGFGTNRGIGPDHKKLRKTLNPVFATRHIRDLLPVFQSVARNVRPLTLILSTPSHAHLTYISSHQLRRRLAADIQSRTTSSSLHPSSNATTRTSAAESEAEIDVLDWISRTALDLIGHGGLGYSFGALEGTKDAYSVAARRLLYVLPFFSPFLPLPFPLPYLFHSAFAQIC